MPEINGVNYNQRQLLESSQCIGRLTLTKHYNHWVANGVPHPDWNSDWNAKGFNPAPTLNPSYHFFGPDGQWHDGYKWDAVPEDSNNRPPDIGTNPAPAYPWGQEDTKKPPIKIETIMGWEYLQDLAQLWSGINLSTNATFPQITNWPVGNADHPYYAKDKAELDKLRPVFTDLNIKNPVAPIAKFNIKLGNPLINRTASSNEIINRGSVRFGPTKGVVGNSYYPFDFADHFRASISFGMSDTEFQAKVVNHWDKRDAISDGQALFPYCHTTVNSNHWYRQKYRDDNVFVFFASIPQPFDSFVITQQGNSLNPPGEYCFAGECYPIPDDGTSPYSVCSMPSFLDYEISGTRRLYKDAQYIPKEVKTSAKIQFNSVILYADNNGTPVLIAASNIDPPIISEGKGKSIFYSKYYFAGKAVTPIDIVEI